MYCGNCGKEIDEKWTNCPYCGKILASISNSKVVVEKAMTETSCKKKKSKKKIVIPIVVVAVIVVFFIYVLTMGTKLEYERLDYVATSQDPYYYYVGEISGYNEWKWSGYPGTARLELLVQYPVPEGKMVDDHYAVYMNAFKTEIGMLISEDGAKLEEWDWLGDIVEEPTDGLVHAIGDVKLVGYTTDEHELPVFEISNAEPFY